MQGSMFSCTVENADVNDRIVWTLDGEILTQEVRYSFFNVFLKI